MKRGDVFLREGRIAVRAQKLVAIKKDSQPPQGGRLSFLPPAGGGCKLKTVTSAPEVVQSCQRVPQPARSVVLIGGCTGGCPSNIVQMYSACTMAYKRKERGWRQSLHSTNNGTHFLIGKLCFVLDFTTHL